jgi:hypothetical protein
MAAAALMGTNAVAEEAETEENAEFQDLSTNGTALLIDFSDLPAEVVDRLAAADPSFSIEEESYFTAADISAPAADSRLDTPHTKPDSLLDTTVGSSRLKEGGRLLVAGKPDGDGAGVGGDEGVGQSNDAGVSYMEESVYSTLSWYESDRVNHCHSINYDDAQCHDSQVYSENELHTAFASDTHASAEGGKADQLKLWQEQSTLYNLYGKHIFPVDDVQPAPACNAELQLEGAHSEHDGDSLPHALISDFQLHHEETPATKAAFFQVRILGEFVESCSWY